jgi:hypothetical protein
MRLLLWTVTIWSVMFLGVVTIDVGYTVSTGTQASFAVTDRIDFTPDESGLLGTMERVSRELDRLGDNSSGHYVWIIELLLYGVLAPLFIAGPLAWEAHRRRWTRSGAILLSSLAGIVIALWVFWKYPDPSAVYYALVNALLLCCRAVGLSYYTGSLVYFIILPLLFAAGYGGIALWRMKHDAPPSEIAKPANANVSPTTG